MRLRSLLYVPVSSDRFVAKAHERGADAIILDLEDAVAPSQKVAARAKLADAVKSVGRNGAIVFVRINADADMIRADADAACRAGAFGLFVPKVHNAHSLAALSRISRRHRASVRPRADAAGADDRGSRRGARCTQDRRRDGSGCAR